MPGPDGVLSCALDFDGSLVELHVHPLKWRHGAKEFIVAAAAAGIRLVLFSCRCAVVGLRELPGDADDFWRAGRVPADVEKSWSLREEMVAFLKAEGVWGLFVPWDAPGKPLVDYFADDRFERPDWIVLAGELGVRLVHGVQPGLASPMGAPGPAAAGVVTIPGPVTASAGPAPGA
jgi:hypothetical protein